MTDNKWQPQETYKSLIVLANTNLRIVLVSNGAAAIAMFTLIGNIYLQSEYSVPHYLISSLIFFLLGVASGGGACIFSYLSEYMFYKAARLELHWPMKEIVNKGVEDAYALKISQEESLQKESSEKEYVKNHPDNYQQRHLDLAAKSLIAITLGITFFCFGSFLGVIALFNL